MDEILKVILNCNKERRLLNGDDIRNICNVVIKRNKYDFIKDIKVAKKHPFKDDCAGTFCEDELFFFYDGIVKFITENCDTFTDSYQVDSATVDICNYYFLSIIFHELAHARQHFLINRNYDSLEKRIFSFFFEMGKNRDFYEANYHDDLTEVNANNVSFVTANYFYSKLPFNFMTSHDKIVFQLQTMKLLLYANYEIDPTKEVTMSPAERIVSSFDEDILKKANMSIEKYAKMIYNNNLTLYKKLMLGLPISYLEYSYANLLIDELNVDEDVHALKKIQKRI